MTTTPTAVFASGVALAVSVIALSSLAPLASATTPCPNEQLRHESNVNPATQQPYDVALPECRAYEMVSPLDKQAHAATPGPNGGPLVSPDGEAIGYVSEGAFSDPANYHVEGARPTNTYIGRRTNHGWVTRPALAPASVISDPTPFGFGGDASPDLSVLTTCGWADLTTGSELSTAFACARQEAETWSATSVFHDLTGSTSASSAIVWGGSSNGRTVVWQPGSGVGLLPGDEVEGGDGAIYQTIGLGTGNTQLRLITVNNEGVPLTTNHGLDGPYLGAARSAPNIEGSVYQAISQDGETVYFTAEPAGGGPLTLYARTSGFAGGTFERPVTVVIGEGATFVGASANGEKVFFVTNARLAAADHDNSADLYMYDFNAPAGSEYTDISAGTASDPTAGSGAEIEAGEFTSSEPRYGSVTGSVIALAPEGSHIYFYAKADLTTEPNAAGEHAGASGGTYCYDTETGETKLVVAFEVETTGAQVTPNGEYLVFDTTHNITPEDTNLGQAVYRYSAETGEIAWLSHPAGGFAATNEGDDARIAPREETLGGRDGGMSYFQDARRAISENGEDVIFVTTEKLQANDVNGAADVYLWHAGEVSLVSDGTTPTGVVEWPGMSATGSDVFFSTAAKLVGQDADELADIYDARIDGGFRPPAPEASCSGEECQGIPSPGPEALTAGGTATAAPSGDLTAPPFVESPEPESTRAVEITSHSSKSLSVSAPGAGKLTLTGSGLATLKKATPKSGAYTLALTLTSSERKLLAKRRSVTLKVRVTFTPTSGKASSATTKVTIRKASPKAKSKSKKKG